MAKRTWWASFNGTLNSVWFLRLLHSNNSSSTTVCFSMLNFQLLTIKESSFPKKEMVAEVLGRFFLSASCSLQDITLLFSCQQHILSLVCAVDSLDWISCQWHLLSIWSSFWKLNVLLKEAMWYLSRIVLEYLNWGIQGESGLKHLQQNV